MLMSGIYNTDDQIIESFLTNDGNVSRAAEELSISTQSLYRRIATNRRLSIALEEIRRGTKIVPCEACHGTGTVTRSLP